MVKEKVEVVTVCDHLARSEGKSARRGSLARR